MAVTDIRRVGVVGAGIMGAGIAEVFTEAGYEVVWYNRSEAGMQRGTGFYTYAAGRAEQLVAERDALLVHLLRLKQASALDARDSYGSEDTPGA